MCMRYLKQEFQKTILLVRVCKLVFSIPCFFYLIKKKKIQPTKLISQPTNVSHKLKNPALHDTSIYSCRILVKKYLRGKLSIFEHMKHNEHRYQKKYIKCLIPYYHSNNILVANEYSILILS